MTMFEKVTAKEVLTEGEIKVALYVGKVGKADPLEVSKTLGYSLPDAFAIFMNLETRGIVENAPEKGYFQLTERYRTLNQTKS